MSLGFAVNFIQGGSAPHPRIFDRKGTPFEVEDLRLNKVKFSRPPFECYCTEVIPPNNF